MSGFLRGKPSGADVEQTFHFDAAMLADAEKIAHALDLSFDALMALAWEIGKTELFTRRAKTVGPDDDPQSQPLGVMPPVPPVRLPAELVIPDIAPELPPLGRSEDRQRLAVMISEQALEEIRVLAVYADRTPSWCLGCAYELARPKLAASRRR